MNKLKKLRRIQEPKLSTKKREIVADLDEKLRWGLISPKRYDQEYERIILGGQSKALARNKGKRVPLSDPSLSSAVGRKPVFPPGNRSDRRRGRTAYLAKKTH